MLIIIYSAILLFCIAVWVSTIGATEAVVVGGGQSFMPRLLCLLLFLSIIADLLLRKVYIKVNLKREMRPMKALPLGWIFYSLCIVLSPLIIYLIGFRWGMLLGIFVMGGLIGREELRRMTLLRKIILCGAAVGTLLFLSWFFENVVKVLLPRGILL